MVNRVVVSVALALTSVGCSFIVGTDTRYVDVDGSTEDGGNRADAHDAGMALVDSVAEMSDSARPCTAEQSNACLQVANSCNATCDATQTTCKDSCKGGGNSGGGDCQALCQNSHTTCLSNCSSACDNCSNCVKANCPKAPK